VLVAGGHSIFCYNTDHDSWTTLPDCPAFHQGLATLNGELLSVGGISSDGVMNIVYTFRDHKWKEILPPMPTPRWFPTTVPYNDELILAAGGQTDKTRGGSYQMLRTVEVYIKNKQWYIIKPLPIPTSISPACVVGNTCYMFEEKSKVILYISLQTLVDAVNKSKVQILKAKGNWKKLTPRHPLFLSSLVELKGKLVAMGGCSELEPRCGTRFISYYDLFADMWVECTEAQLPVPLYRPGVVKLADNKVMVIGGQPEMQKFSSEVYIAKVN
jgi:hypothetical protein